MQVRVKPWIAGLAAVGIVAACTTSDSATGDVEIIDAVDPAPSSEPLPSPPPPPEVASEEAVGSVVVSGKRASGAASTDVLSDSGIIRPEPPRDQPEPQAGMLTAGDYDDVLNPDLYKAYIDRMLQGQLSGRDLPFIDADQRIAIKVVDRLGKPVPLARISLTTADGAPMFPLRTSADGMAYIYPNYDALEAGMVVSVAGDGGQALSQPLAEDMLKNGGELAFDLSGDAMPAQKLDLLLTVDATGSMGDEMRYLQVELIGILDRVKEANPALDIRVGFVLYRDKGDAYVVKQEAFTGDLEAFKNVFSEQSADGGGDFPEAMHAALEAGLGFDWRDDAVKVNLLVADAPPHDSDISATWDSALISRSRGIHVVPLAASGVDKTAEFLMRAMAQMTGGRYLFLTNDSGIGNPHAEPTVDCYVVTRLDGLVQRVLDSLVTGVRVEPDGDDVIRTVGNYRLGMCQLEDQQSG